MGHFPQEDPCQFFFPSFHAGCWEAILLRDTVHLVKEGRETEDSMGQVGMSMLWDRLMLSFPPA